MRMRRRRKWWFFGGRRLRCDAGSCGFVGGGFCCGHGGEDGGHVLALQVGGGWRGGPGCDLAARQADLVGSGGGGRRGAAVFAFWAWLGHGPAMREVVWVGVRGGNSSRGLHSGAGGIGPGFPRVCAGGVCGPLGGVGVPWGVGLLAVGLCGLLGVRGGEGCLLAGSVAGVCCFFGGWGRPVSRGRGLRAMVGVCGPPVVWRGGRGRGGGCAGGCVVSVRVSACSGTLLWSVVGWAVWRRSLPSSAAAARTSQMIMRIWCTSWSVVGRGYASFGLRPTRRRILWMAWYLQVRECCSLGGGVLRRVWACLNLCVGGGDGPSPGHGPCGWPAALDPLGQAVHGQSEVVARPP